MKLRSLLETLMVIAAVVILIVHLAIGSPLDKDRESLELLLWAMTLIICIGTVIHPISKEEKSLDWVIGASCICVCMCLCALLGWSDKVMLPELFFVLYLLELLLSVGYKIGKWCGVLD